MGGKKKKPAKMGHQRSSNPVIYGPTFSATFKEVIALINDDREAIVVLDDKGTRAIVDAHWVMKNSRTGKLEPIRMACPIVYDANRRSEAIRKYQHYQQSHKEEVDGNA